MNTFDGHRIYNGCPDSTLQAKLNAIERAEKKMRKRFPESHVTYFPMEGQYQAHIWGKPLSAVCETRLEAIEQALSL